MSMAEHTEQGLCGVPGVTWPVWWWHWHRPAHRHPPTRDTPQAARCPWPRVRCLPVLASSTAVQDTRLCAAPRWYGGSRGQLGPHRCCRCQGTFASGERTAHGTARAGVHGGDVGDFTTDTASGVKALGSRACNYSNTIARRQGYQNKIR